jgi:WD40 repeat protein
MNAFLAFLEKLLIGIFALGIVIIGALGLWHYRGGKYDEGDPWRHVKKKNSIEAYLGYLRECQSCPREAEAEAALDLAQKSLGLISRLDRSDFPDRASIGIPVLAPNSQTVLATAGEVPDFWDAESGKYRPRDGKFLMARGAGVIQSLAFSEDGNRVAAGMSGPEGGRMLVWNVASGKLIAENMVQDFDIKAIEFAPQGALIGWLAHGPAGTWDPSTGKVMRATHDGASAMAFYYSKGSRALLMTASGKELWYWDPLTLELVRQVSIKTDRRLLGLSRDGRLIAYVDGQVLELWDTATALLVATIAKHDGEVLAFCREPNKGRVAVGTREGTLYVWNLEVPAEALGKVPAHEGPIEHLACSAEDRAVTASWDGAKVWNLDRVAKSLSQDKSSGVAKSLRKK